MRKSIKISISNGFRNLEIQKRDRKRKQTDIDKLDNVDLENRTDNSSDLIHGQVQEGAPSSAGSTAESSTWCDLGPSGSGDVCLAGTPYSPISCSHLQKAAFGDEYYSSYVLLPEYSQFQYDSDKNIVSAVYSLGDNSFQFASAVLTNDSGIALQTPTGEWQSVYVSKAFGLNQPTYVYYRQIPSDTKNGEWFMDQWSSGSGDSGESGESATTSCFCKNPGELYGPTLGTLSESEYKCYQYENTSFYMTFDGIYFSIFFSDGSVSSFEKTTTITKKTITITNKSSIEFFITFPSNGDEAVYKITPN